MARKPGILDAGKKTVVKAAKLSAEGVKDVASEALGAAAATAAGVVLKRASEALSSGQKKVDEAVPANQTVSEGQSHPRRKPTKKRHATRQRTRIMAGAAKKRSAAKKRRSGRAGR